MKIKKQPLVSIIIVNWNGLKWLKKCLCSIETQTYPQIEVIFVDNASSDGSVKYVKRNFPKTKIIETGTNLGFAGGNNAGIALSKGEMILLLNTDTWVEKNFLETLINIFEQRKLDVIAPYEADYFSGNKKGVYISTIDFLGYPIYLPINKSVNKASFYLTGACLLFPKKLYLETGGMDNNFFMYCEEVDWFWRLNLYNKHFNYTDATYVYHAGGGSTGYGLKYTTFLWRNQNMLQMLLKNYAWYNLLWILPLYITQNIIEMLVFLVLFQPKISLSYIQGWIFNIKFVRQIFTKRNDIQKFRKSSDYAIFKKMFGGLSKWLNLVGYLQLKFKKSFN